MNRILLMPLFMSACIIPFFGCTTSIPLPDYVGTWHYEETGVKPGDEYLVLGEDGFFEWTWYFSGDSTPSDGERGTYTVSGNEMTITRTQTCNSSGVWSDRVPPVIETVPFSVSENELTHGFSGRAPKVYQRQ
jgi:hypothetical protein